jgi:hypothetical protein
VLVSDDQQSLPPFPYVYLPFLFWIAKLPTLFSLQNKHSHNDNNNNNTLNAPET